MISTGAVINSSFSLRLPAMQLAWDNTSFVALKRCPRYYQLTIIEGWQSRAQSVHLTFGIHMHTAREVYDHSRASGSDHEVALRDALRRIMVDTWDVQLQRPWASDDPNKNRRTLLRTIVWYLDEYRDDPIRTLQLANGRPAVELSFSLDTTYRTQDGETILLCGHIDRIGELGGKNYVCDVKTSKHLVDARFFDGFKPNGQFSQYTFAAKAGFSVPVEGVIVDGIQVAVTFSRVARAPSPRTDAELDEWYRSVGHWVRIAEQFARDNYWPMNEESCGSYGGCPFRIVCSHAPAVRQKWLEASFVRRTWDPLKARGEV